MSQIHKLKWEWPADREKDSCCRARVTKIYPNKKLFNSPSVVGHIPDPFVVEANLLDGSVSQLIQLEIPYPEIKNLKVDDVIQLDLIGADICIAILKK